MNNLEIPAIDSFFNIEEALKCLGFSIDDKDGGWSVAYVIYEPYGEVFIEFYQAFISHVQSDMKVYYCDKTTNDMQVLFLGIAPTNQHDFNTLMQLLLPNKEYISRIESSHFSNMQ